MAHIESFTIDGYTYEHTDENDALDRFAREEFLGLCGIATQDWRTEDWKQCKIEDENLVFAVSDSEGAYYATWALYRVMPADGDPDVITAYPGPMFSDINARIPQAGLTPDGQVVNQDEIDAATARSHDWWRRTFSVMEWMFMNPMPLEAGGNFVVDHWTFPLESKGDLRQHEWYGVKKYFDDYCKLEVLFETDSHGQGDVAVETLKQWKVIDPDPGRARGSINP